MKNVLAYGLVFGLGTAGVVWARVAALRPDPEAERVLNSPGVIEKALARARESAAEAGDGKPPDRIGQNHGCYGILTPSRSY